MIVRREMIFVIMFLAQALNTKIILLILKGLTHLGIRFELRYPS